MIIGSFEKVADFVSRLAKEQERLRKEGLDLAGGTEKFVYENLESCEIEFFKKLGEKN